MLSECIHRRYGGLLIVGCDCRVWGLPDLADCCPVCTALTLNAAGRHVLLCGLNLRPRLREHQSLQQSQMLATCKASDDLKPYVLLNMALLTKGETWQAALTQATTRHKEVHCADDFQACVQGAVIAALPAHTVQLTGREGHPGVR